MATKMIPISERLQFAYETMVGRQSKKFGGKEGPPGGISLGSGLMGGPLYMDSWGTQRGPSPWELIEAFKSISFFCTNTNANAVATNPLRLYVDASRGNKPRDISDPKSIKRSTFQFLRKTGYISGSSRVDDIHEIRNHPLIDVLDKPDQDEDGFDRFRLLHTISRYCDVIGACYIWPNGLKGMPPREMWVLFSQYVLPIRKAGKAVIDTYNYFAETFQKGEIYQFKHYISLRDPFGPGYSALYASMMYLKLEDRFVSVQEQLLAQGPRPNILVSPKDPNMPIGQAEKDRFELDLQRKHSKGMQGSVLVVNGSWDVTPLSFAPTDLAGLKIAEYDLERACSCFDCPIEFFSPDTNLANLQAAEHKHATKGVNPRCHSIAARLTRIAKQYDPRLFFAFDNADAADEERDAKIFDINIKNGRMTINQANIETEFPPVPWGDQPWMPNNVATPDMLEEAHKSTIKSQQAGAKAQLMAAQNPPAGPAGKTGGTGGKTTGKSGKTGGSQNKTGKKNGKGGAGGRPKNPAKPTRAITRSELLRFLNYMQTTMNDHIFDLNSEEGMSAAINHYRSLHESPATDFPDDDDDNVWFPDDDDDEAYEDIYGDEEEEGYDVDEDDDYGGFNSEHLPRRISSDVRAGSSVSHLGQHRKSAANAIVEDENGHFFQQNQEQILALARSDWASTVMQNLYLPKDS